MRYISESTSLLDIALFFWFSWLIGAMAVLLFSLSGELYIRLYKKSKEDNWEYYWNTTYGEIGSFIFNTLLGLLIIYLFF